jgi:hypothetical protein
VGRQTAFSIKSCGKLVIVLKISKNKFKKTGLHVSDFTQYEVRICFFSPMFFAKRILHKAVKNCKNHVRGHRKDNLALHVSCNISRNFHPLPISLSILVPGTRSTLIKHSLTCFFSEGDKMSIKVQFTKITSTCLTHSLP